MRKLLIGAVATTVAALLLVPTAWAAPDEINTERLRNGVTTSGILSHMRAFQRVANANEGNRAANTTGYDASLDYVERRMEARRLRGHARRVRLRGLRPDQLASAAGRPGLRAEDSDYIVAQFSGRGRRYGPDRSDRLHRTARGGRRFHERL